MHAYRYENNLEAEVMSAGPVRLVEMLCRGALDATAAARCYLLAGDIPARSRQITKAQAILTELSASLDRERGGVIAERLAGLYAYMLQRLAEGNFRQVDEPLAETERLLRTLTEAWEECATATEPAFALAINGAAREHRSYDFVG